MAHLHASPSENRFKPTPYRFRSLLSGLASLAIVTGASAAAQQLRPVQDLTFRECYAHLRGDQLTLGNAHIKRSWRIDHGRLFPTSLFDADSNSEWIGTPAHLPSPTPPAPAGPGSIQMRAGSGVFGPTEAESLRVELEDTAPATTVTYTFQIFPNATGVRIAVAQHGHAAPGSLEAPGSPEAPATKDAPEATDALDVIERLQTSRPHLRFTQVILRDRTDNRNELVFEQEWLLQPNESRLELQGNVFFLEDTLTGAGLVFLKEAPLPDMRPVSNPFDARMKGSQTGLNNIGERGHTFFDISFFGHGFQGDGQGYASALIAYQGGRAGRIAALQTYQRQIRTYRPGRDGQLLSNTWGDRSGGAKLNEAFIRSEIDAGSRLGIDIVQVDDGWETGKTIANKGAGGVWEGYRSHQPDFWQPSPNRFPHGMAPLADYAHARGIRLGLWFGPDSSNNFENWKQDADQLLAWNAQDHIAAFKLDSVKLRSKTSETNYHALVDRVLQVSSGAILLDLDVTAETRQGFFGNIAAGPLFLENRYTDSHRYWPHQTLRNLWKLAQYVDPVRLRVEFLNPERNTALYPDDPLAPANYRADALFAGSMFASPLGWFENTALSPAFVADAKPVIAEWKKQRDTLYTGTTIPIGEAPDGIAWTGFQSIAPDRRSGFLLVFRELNSEPTWELPCGLLQPGNYRIQLLAGEGSVSQSAKGFQVRVASPLGFVWARLAPSP